MKTKRKFVAPRRAEAARSRRAKPRAFPAPAPKPSREPAAHEEAQQESVSRGFWEPELVERASPSEDIERA